METKLGTYRHYKGHLCDVIGIARHSETLEEMVVYRHRDNSPKFGENALWVRPKSMFEETVIVDGKKQPRFTFITT